MIWSWRHHRAAFVCVLFLITAALPVIRSAAGPLLRIESIETDRFPQLQIEGSVEFPYDGKGGGGEFRIKPEALELVESYRGREQKLTLEGFREMNGKITRVNLVMIIDSTLSVPGRDFRQSLKSANSLIDIMAGNDRAAVYSLNGEVHLRVGYTGDKEKLKKGVSKINRDGRVTRIFDALHAGLVTARTLAIRDQSRKGIKGNGPSLTSTAVILFTDGRDEGSFITYNDCIQLADLGTELRVPVYVVLFGRQGNRRNFTRLTRLTGGRLHEPTAGTNPGGILADLRNPPLHFFRVSARSATVLRNRALPWSRAELFLTLKSDVLDDTASARYVLPWRQTLHFYAKNPWFIVIAVLAALLLLAALILPLLLYWRKRLQLRRRAEIRRLTGERAGRSSDEFEGMPTAATGEGTRGGLPETMAAPLPVSELLKRRARAGEEERIRYLRTYSRRMLEHALREARPYASARLLLRDASRRSFIREYDLFQDAIVIGSGRWSDIRLDDRAVSRVHARIRRVDGRYIIYDLVSNSGVYVNGKKLLRPRGLFDGDELKLGHSRFLFYGKGAGVS